MTGQVSCLRSYANLKIEEKHYTDGYSWLEFNLQVTTYIHSLIEENFYKRNEEAISGLIINYI